MNKICTSIDQSKKLIELGIDVNTADMRYHTDSMYETYPCDEIVYTINFGKPQKYNKYDIPAWSLSALMELMNCICYNVSLNCHGAEWNIKFDDSEKYKDFTKDYPLDAAFEMVCWLLENDRL